MLGEVEQSRAEQWGDFCLTSPWVWSSVKAFELP